VDALYNSILNLDLKIPLFQVPELQQFRLPEFPQLPLIPQLSFSEISRLCLPDAWQLLLPAVPDISMPAHPREDRYLNLDLMASRLELGPFFDALGNYDSLIESSHGLYHSLAFANLDQLHAASKQLLALEEISCSVDSVSLLDFQSPFSSTVSSALTDQLVRLVMRGKRGVDRFSRCIIRNLRRKLRVRSLRSRIEGLIEAITRCLEISERRFCGHAWTYRTWYLLHGSHPPKMNPQPIDIVMAGGARIF
jgi:hypothetical protein